MVEKLIFVYLFPVLLCTKANHFS